ncbi:hypothetical protein SDC9_185932 [bioreactor metagenome]|uniref:Uncharacterized protein n=1 Tax=bioreactor metagenome TaxID=1076179 RepID=A0A645HHA1_9ZZZZ
MVVQRAGHGGNGTARFAGDIFDRHVVGSLDSITGNATGNVSNTFIINLPKTEVNRPRANLSKQLWRRAVFCANCAQIMEEK